MTPVLLAVIALVVFVAAFLSAFTWAKRPRRPKGPAHIESRRSRA